MAQDRRSAEQIANIWEGSTIITRTLTSSADMTTAADISPAPSSGDKLVITDLIISTDTGMNVTLKEETSGTIVAGPYYVTGNNIYQVTTRSRYLKLPTADRKLQAQASVAGNVTIEVWSYSET